MSGTTSQPNLNSIAAALMNTRRDAGLDHAALQTLENYWEEVRSQYQAFDAGLSSGSARVYLHEMPGGQYTNLQEQAIAMGLGSNWHDVVRTYAEVNMLFGDIVKVTPSSKVVGDMSLYLVSHGMSVRHFRELGPDHSLTLPNSVIDMFEGSLGEPPGGWPPDVQAVILKGRNPRQGRPGALLPPIDLGAAARELEDKAGRPGSGTDLMSYLMYPEVYLKFDKNRQIYGDVSVLPTLQFFYGMERGEEIAVELEPGKTLIVKFLTVGEPHPDGTRTVFFELNGQPREVTVTDTSLKKVEPERPKANNSIPGHVAAPIPGAVTSIAVEVGQKVEKGERLLVMEAMKMQTTVYAPVEGTIQQVLVTSGNTVDAKDLLVVVE
jgi:pyruvate carboxylase